MLGLVLMSVTDICPALLGLVLVPVLVLVLVLMSATSVLHCLC